MVYEFKFPDVGEGIHEGEIVKWFVKEGQKVKADEPLGEIETDKAIVEMPSPKSGKILKLHVPAGGIIHVGEIMVTILEEHETEEDAKKHMEAKKAEAKGDIPYTGSVVGFVEEAKEVSPIYGAQQQTKPLGGAGSASATVQATPAVRNLAKQLNVDLNNVKGSGPGGRITIEDVQKAAGSEPKQASAPAEPSSFKKVRKYDFFGYVDREPLKGVKKATAAKMAESIFTAAQLTNMHEADVTDLWALREKEKSAYEKEGIKLTLMPYIVKAAACALMSHPYLNASLEGEEIVFKKYYNIGVAVDSEEGLFVPVVKGAQNKDIKAIAKDIQKMANDVQSRKVNMMDLKGGSFTVSNLGSVGVEFFTPIINYPESAILGVGRVIDKPVARNGKVEIRKILPLSVTYDHRLVDGAQAARFGVELVKRLEALNFDVPEVKEGH
ncbi:2-oxo acid dehydrogenase subunit E2 [Candidatus Woesearchaeota archaeon]|nr:2-oxo acid dehydrogenase subunit E2 [Candidatus Woesearchaeota archaeon]